METSSVTSDPEEILLRANALFHTEESQDSRGLIAQKIEALRHYDVLAMDRVAAVLAWGRSGSVLLSSYLDGHEDVILLPEVSGWKLYEFFERYQSLPWRDKLIAYPAYVVPHVTGFFDGDFAISPAQYYASVQAILEFYADWPPNFLESRRAFLLFVHLAYELSLGRRPSSSHPLIVYAQHNPDNGVARQLLEDFPQVKFVHIIRDPISSCNAMFRFVFGTLAENAPRSYFLAPYWALLSVIDQDRPQLGMESRTRTIRFEDLHSDTVRTIHDLCDWLGLPYQATLLESTFNGIPLVTKSDGKVWSGPRLERVQRYAPNLSPKDRALLYALLYENFIDWNYPCPKIFGNPVVRCLVFVSLVAFPMKMEIIAARGLFKRWILPAVRKGNLLRAIKSLLGMGFYRLKIIQLLVPSFFRRCVSGTTLLQVDHKPRPAERRDDGVVAARNEAELK
jgi:hypothetical protein